MRKQNGRTDLSRRQFLGGSAAALGGLSLGALHPEILEAQMGGAAQAPSMGMDRFAPKGAPDEAFWRMIRREFNIVDDMTAYMNNGTLGPMPNVVLEANVRFLREIAADPRNPLGNQMEATRSKLAAFVGADPDEIVLNRSTTEGEKQFCAGLDLNEGDEVVCSTHEHGGGLGSWRARQQRDRIKIVQVPIPAPPESVDQIVGLIEKAITPRTKVILVSYPIYVTGLLMPVKPLADMAHKRGLLLTVDGAHALGMLDLNMHAMGMDHFTTAGQKWLMAGTGTGLAYFKRDIQSRVWADMMGGGPENPKEGARKYERSGQRNIPSALGMGVAADFQAAIGKNNVQNRVRFLAARLKDGMKGIPGTSVYTSSSDEMSGGLTTIAVNNVPKANLQKAAMDRAGIFITLSGLNDFSCRISTHIYTSPSDVDRLLEVVKYVAANASKFATPTAAAAAADE
jgi:selenocysteine lyase/cysteine desulfurase